MAAGKGQSMTQARSRIAFRLAVVTAVVTTTSAVTTLPAQAASWTPPATVSAPDGVASQQQAAIDGAGTATVVWAERRTADIDVIKAARRAPGGSWSAPVTLSNPERDADEPQIVAAPDGLVVAAWVENATASAADGRRVMAATLRPGGSWDAARAISAAGGVSRPRLARNKHGDAIVAWHQRNGLRSSRLNAGATSWGTPQPIAGSGRQHEVALDFSGTAHAAWKDTDSEGIDRIKASRATRNGAWETATTLSRAGRHGEQPAVVTGKDGSTVQVLWVLRSSVRVVQAAHRTSGGWSQVQTISDKTRNAVRPEGVLDGQGNATAVWQVNLDSTQSGVAAAGRPASGTWGTPEQLTTAGAAPQIGVDDGRTVHVVWLVNRATDADDRVEAVLRPPSGTWSGPGTVAAENELWSVGLAVDGSGRAVAVWRQTVGPGDTDPSRVRASVAE